ncbi:MAG: phosphoglucosamine mutase, partial [Burkholderiaceae bacterium]
HHLADAVRSNQADFGIALDGDADRVVIADAEGRIYNGDELLYVIVRDRMRYAKVNGVAGTLMTNYSLERRLRELGIPFARARVGDRYVLETLQEKNWLYGGEGSGHLLFLDCHTTGDGIVSALQVLSAARRQSKSLAQMTEDLVLMPQALVNAVVQRGFEWRSHSALVAAVSDAERELNGSGRVLIRPSGTEPVLRVMVEASEAKIAEAMAQRLASIVLRPALN